MLSLYNSERFQSELKSYKEQIEKVSDLRIKSKLENHKKIRHEKSCSVICDQCGKECLTKYNLDNHMKMVHHMYKIAKEDTIKKCDKCDIEFENPEYFNNHLKQCLDELKDFKCKFCDKNHVCTYKPKDM